MLAGFFGGWEILLILALPILALSVIAVVVFVIVRLTRHVPVKCPHCGYRVENISGKPGTPYTCPRPECRRGFYIGQPT